MKINLKTPISYYGGKQSMLGHILPEIPPHKIYCEPFFGGGAVFWAKEPSMAEVINDCNGMVVNFYEQLKLNFDELKKLVDSTLFSRDVYKHAMVVYTQPYIFNPVTKAWAFWVLTTQGFNNQIESWRSSQLHSKTTKMNNNKKLMFSQELSDRLALTQIDNMDAVGLIRKMDTINTFFYIDPPYVDANQGHYGGYTQQHFDDLLNTLATIKGKFLLSSYENDTLTRLANECGWKSKGIDLLLTAGNGKKRKIEVITTNYTF